MTTKWLTGAATVPPRLRRLLVPTLFLVAIGLGNLSAPTANSDPGNPGPGPCGHGVTVDTNDPMPPEEPNIPTGPGQPFPSPEVNPPGPCQQQVAPNRRPAPDQQVNPNLPVNTNRLAP